MQTWRKARRIADVDLADLLDCDPTREPSCAALHEEMGRLALGIGAAWRWYQNPRCCEVRLATPAGGTAHGGLHADSSGSRRRRPSSCAVSLRSRRQHSPRLWSDQIESDQSL